MEVKLVLKHRAMAVWTGALYSSNNFKWNLLQMTVLSTLCQIIMKFNTVYFLDKCSCLWTCLQKVQVQHLPPLLLHPFLQRLCQPVSFTYSVSAIDLTYYSTSFVFCTCSVGYHKFDRVITLLLDTPVQKVRGWKPIHRETDCRVYSWKDTKKTVPEIWAVATNPTAKLLKYPKVE